MRKGNRSFLLLLLLSEGFSGMSQHYFYNEDYYDAEWLWEAGISVGAMNGLTDIGGKNGPGRPFLKDWTVSSSQLYTAWYTNLLYRYTWGLTLEAGAGSIFANDHLIKNPTDEAMTRFLRNLNVRTRIKELQLLAECFPLSLLQGDRPEAFINPYLIGGVSIFHFSPETKLDNRWIALAPLRTEGQGFAEYPHRIPYSLTQIAFPVGAGCSFDISPKFHIRLEGVHRILQTDYLDDVSTNYIDPYLFDKYLDPSQASLARLLYNRHKELDPLAREDVGGKRGNPKKNDAYFSINIKLGWIINRTRR